MESLIPTNATSMNNESQKDLKNLELSLPKDHLWFGIPGVFYQDFWCPTFLLERVISFQTHFQAQDTDIILASLPKTGTTWLKSLIFSIVNRKNLHNHPFHTKNPHELVPQLEYEVYKSHHGEQFDFTQVPLPRLFGTHVPYFSLPDSIRSSECRIVYICRNPMDTFVSLWHYYLQFKVGDEIPKPNLEEYVDKFCKGVIPYGPYDEHLLGFWKESLKNPKKVLFLEYEGLKKEPKDQLRRLAKFLGCPIEEEEEKSCVIDEIIELCSLKSLKEMEVNTKSGDRVFALAENKALFRKGEVGDWSNHLTPSMGTRLNQLLHKKLKENGFSFTYYKT